MGDNVIEDGATIALEAIRECMVEIDRYIPVLGWFLETMTQWPEARHQRIYDLADTYERAGELYRTHLDEIEAYLGDLDSWQGDGAAAAMRQRLQEHLQEAANMVEVLDAVQQTVHAKALEIESMKWMAVSTLVLMIIALIQAIVTAWTGVGGVSGVIAMITARQTIQRLSQHLVTRLWQETVKAGFRQFTRRLGSNIASAAVRGGVGYVKVMGGIKGGIMLIQAAEGHDPFTEGWATRFGVEMVDTFIAGAIGGPLSLGVRSRVTEAVSFGVGQAVDNVFQYQRDRWLDQAGLDDWAKRNHLYSGMTKENLLEAVTPAALIGEILSEPGGRRGARPDMVTPAVDRAALNLFGDGRTAPAQDVGTAEPNARTGQALLATPLGTPVTPLGPATSPAGVPGSTPAPAQAAAPATASAPAPAPATAAPATASVSAPATASPPAAAPAGAAGSPGSGGSPAPGSGGSIPGSGGSGSSGGAGSSGSPSSSGGSGTAGADPAQAQRGGDPGGTVADPTAAPPSAGGDPAGDPATTPGDPAGTATSPDTASTRTAGSGTDDGTVDAATRPTPTELADRAGPPPNGSDGHPSGTPSASMAASGPVLRESPGWWDWKARVEQQVIVPYARGVADHFAAPDGATPGTRQLTPEMVQRALDTPSETLDRYGARLRGFIERHFAHIDETGVRRPMDQGEIAAKLAELRGQPGVDPATQVTPRAGGPATGDPIPDGESTTRGGTSTSTAPPDVKPHPGADRPVPGGMLPGGVFAGGGSPGGIPTGSTRHGGDGGGDGGTDRPRVPGQRPSEPDAPRATEPDNPATDRRGTVEPEFDPRKVEEQLLAALDPVHRAELERAIDAARKRADRSLSHLRQVVGRVDPNGDRATLVGTDKRVKELASLARTVVGTYVDEAPDIAGFVAETKDLVRFSVRTSPADYGRTVRDVLDGLRDQGYRLAGDRAIKNFWRPGNRYLGLNVNLRDRSGNLLEVQFPTDISWEVGIRTHRLYEIVRLDVAPPSDRVDAFLEILRLNRDGGLAGRLPEGLDQLPLPKDTSFEGWVDERPGIWSTYLASLTDSGRTFADVVRAHGLTTADFPQASKLGLGDDHGQVRVLRDAQGGGGAAVRAGGDPADHRSVAGGGVARAEERVDLLPVDGGDQDLRRPVLRPEEGGGPADGGADRPGEPGHGPAERGRTDPDVRGGSQPGSILTGSPAVTPDHADWHRGREGGEPPDPDAEVSDWDAESPASGGRHAQVDPDTVVAAPAAEETRGRLVDKVWDRVSNLFRPATADPETLRREEADRKAYERHLRKAQHTFWQAVEANPKLQRIRRDADSYAIQEQLSRAESALMRDRAWQARSAEQSIREQAQLVRTQGRQAGAPFDYVNRLERDADQAAANATRLEEDARSSERRAAEAHERYEQARQAIDDFTTRRAAKEHLREWEYANLVDGGFSTVGDTRPAATTSALTGRDEPPPVWRSRPYDKVHGLRRVLQVDQVRLERMLADGRGGYQRTPDPTGAWLRQLNAFGIEADPTRTQNCNDAVASFFDTYVHGRPTVAAPRTFDGYVNGDPRQPWAGEDGGPGRIEDLTGGRYQSLTGDLTRWPQAAATARVDDAFAGLQRQLLAGGHGSFASIITGWRGGGSHAWAAVNHHGAIHFIDPQQGRVVVARPGDGGTRFVDAHTGEPLAHPIYGPDQIVAVDALVVDAMARPVPFGDLPPGGWNERPLTPEYLSQQPPEVRAAASTAISHHSMRAEHDRAVAYEGEAIEARRAERDHAARAESLRQRARAAIEQEAVHRDRRDAAWAAADRAERAAAQHAAATDQTGDRRDAVEQGHAARTAWHEGTAQHLYQEAQQLRAGARGHEDQRREAQTRSQELANLANDHEVRRQEYARTAQQAELAAARHRSQAGLFEKRRAESCAEAAHGYERRADAYQREAERYAGEAARRAADDPIRRQAEARAGHHRRLAEAARSAASHHRAVQRRLSTADRRDEQAARHSRQAEQSRQSAAAHERSAVDHEEHGAVAWNHARTYDAAVDEFRQAAAVSAHRDPRLAESYRQQAEAYREAAQHYRTRAAQHAAEAEAARVRAGHHHRTADTAERAAVIEREAAAADRAAVDEHLNEAGAWQREQWQRQVREDPGTAAPGASASATGGPTNRPGQMFRDPDPEEWAALDIGRATLRDLGLDPAELSPDQRQRLERSLRRTALLPPERLRFTQRSVSPRTGDGIPAPDLARAMRDGGWRGQPMHGVRWGDGSVSSLDNRRLRAARDAGLDRVPMVVHGPGERLDDWPDEWPRDRRERHALAVDIRELADGSWVVGGDEGRIRFARGTVARTFGEMAVFRAAEQRSLLPGKLFGAERPPVVLGKPDEPATRAEIRNSERDLLSNAIDSGHAAVGAIAADLAEIGRVITRRLALPEAIVLRGEENRVKTVESLERKYQLEGNLLGPEEFLRRVNDIIRFSLELPGGESYLLTVDAVMNELQARQYLIDGKPKNFWQAGNRYHGLNLTVRSERHGLWELQLPTAVSWRANKLTHDFYEVFRDPAESPIRQVHALLSMLRVNQQLGLVDLVPPGVADRWEPKDTSLAKWALKNPAAWQQYRRWLADNGWQFNEVVAEFGLTAEDLPVSQDVARQWGDDDVQLLRALLG
ncbi:toxin glutamine deamidase domain-containing protein [Plantactinospora sp. GCM10030261]|uniref:toxin glutamine deamidase domain-containing protein n=1 Tax=Plantactinospora sp. GCM10030261 TaxID=3273420 RepID=UPI0036063A20